MGPHRPHLRHRETEHPPRPPGPAALLVVDAGITPDPEAAFGYASGELLQILEGFEIVRHEQLEGSYDWGAERIQLVRLVARRPLP